MPESSSRSLPIKASSLALLGRWYLCVLRFRIRHDLSSITLFWRVISIALAPPRHPKHHNRTGGWAERPGKAPSLTVTNFQLSLTADVS